MPQAPFAQFPRACIDESNLLKARMIIAPYNQHVRLLSSEPFGWFAPPKSTRAEEPTLFVESLRSKLLAPKMGLNILTWPVGRTQQIRNGSQAALNGCSAGGGINCDRIERSTSCT